MSSINHKKKTPISVSSIRGFGNQSMAPSYRVEWFVNFLIACAVRIFYYHDLCLKSTMKEQIEYLSLSRKVAVSCV